RRQQRERKQNAKLGFVGQQSEEYTGKPRSALHKSERQANQSCSEKPVMSEQDIKNDRRRRESYDDCRRTRNDRVDCRQTYQQGGDHPNRKSGRIGQQAKRIGQKQKGRRIIKLVIQKNAAARAG